MIRRSLVVTALLLIAAFPLSASQFREVSFDEVARGAAYIVRGTIGPVHSAWDASGEVIYSTATLRVSKYFGEIAGPDVLMIREVGGTVDGYVQEAIGFPVLREGQEVILMLAPWDDGADYRIHAFNQGKFIVRRFEGQEVVTADPVQQGHARMQPRDAHVQNEAFAGPQLTLEEFEQMVIAAREGRGFTANHRE